MSKKTAPKTTKKPTQLDRIEKALSEDRAVRDGEQTAYAGSLVRVHRKLDDLSKRLTVLESRSAPAEAWVPKVGDWVVITGGLAAREDGLGSITKVLELRDGIPWIKSSNFRFGLCTRDNSREFPIKTWRDAIRPATPAEIASHKAKEEQRAKEAGWAKFDVLHPGDGGFYTADQINKINNLLNAAGMNGWAQKTREKWQVCWMPEYTECPLQANSCEEKLSFAEFLRRLQGTIAKRAEEERAKEMAKPVAFGALVRINECPHIEARFLWWDTNEKKIARIAYYSEQSCGTKEYTRDQFQIID